MKGLCVRFMSRVWCRRFHCIQSIRAIQNASPKHARKSTPHIAASTIRNCLVPASSGRRSSAHAIEVAIQCDAANHTMNPMVSPAMPAKKCIVKLWR
jgi:hypothetical protein